ncbi:MAG: hypothetical protein V3V95_08815, partial [Thermodesulfobacteriota bacterium]
VALFPNNVISKVKLGLVEAILKEASAFAASRGISFMVVIQPSANDLTENMQPNYKELSRYPEYDRENLTKPLELILQRNGIKAANLFNTFLQNDPNNLFFLGDDNHWNDQGQALSAKVVGKYIMNNSLLE